MPDGVERREHDQTGRVAREDLLDGGVDRGERRMGQLRLDRRCDVLFPDLPFARGAEQRDRQERESGEADQRPHRDRRRVHEQPVLVERVDPGAQERAHAAAVPTAAARYAVSSGVSGATGSGSVAAAASAASTASSSPSPSAGGASGSCSARSSASIAASSSSLGSSPPSGMTSVFTSTRTSWKRSIGTS